MVVAKRLTSVHNHLVESSLDDEAMEVLQTLRRRTNIDEVTDQA